MWNITAAAAAGVNYYRCFAAANDRDDDDDRDDGGGVGPLSKFLARATTPSAGETFAGQISEILHRIRLHVPVLSALIDDRKRFTVKIVFLFFSLCPYVIHQTREIR